MELLELPTRWMFYLALERGRTRSPKSWKAYAEQLLDWLRHCDANGWNVFVVKDGHLAAYRRHMLKSKTILGRAFSPATINARLKRPGELTGANKCGLMPSDCQLMRTSQTK